MANFYQKIKGWLANPNMFHIWYAYFLANVYACLFKFGGAVDPLLYIIVCPVLSWMTLVFVECLEDVMDDSMEFRGGSYRKEYDEGCWRKEFL